MLSVPITSTVLLLMDLTLIPMAVAAANLVLVAITHLALAKKMLAHYQLVLTRWVT